MSGMLHPVGPEPAQTYWLRRALVVAAAVLALVLFAVAVANATGSGSATPSPAPGLASSPASPTPPATSATPAVRGSSTAPRLPPTARSSAATRSSTSDRPTASATRVRPSATPTARSSRPAATPRPAVPTCDPARLRVTLTGARTLRPEQATRFVLSVINGSKLTCVTAVSPRNFELRIYSGRDRIFTTNHCGRSVPARRFALIPEEAHAWTVTWNGRRSRSECRTRTEVPRPGTYVATADLDGADPVKLRLRLAG